MKILVTGGAGFIGSHFIRYVRQNHPAYKIINLDKLTYAGNLENLADIRCGANYRFIKGDICDSGLVGRLAKGADVIINFAASTHVDRSITNAADFIQTNVAGTQVLLDAAKRYKLKLFLQISSDEVYGSCKTGAFKEDGRLSASSPYAASKAAADLLCRAYFTTYGLPVVITRSSNNFGPYQYPEKIIPLFITNALENKKLPLYASGLNTRDWLFVLDNCRAIDVVLHKGKAGEVYNIGGGNLITNLKLSRLILKKLSKSAKLIKHVKDRPGHDWRYCIDCAKIKRLGWRPRFDFEAALMLTVDWYKVNRNWWQKLKS